MATKDYKVEFSQTYYQCDECGYIWGWNDTACPECGKNNMVDISISEIKETIEYYEGSALELKKMLNKHGALN